MYHTLRTLLEHTERVRPELIARFKLLRDYCIDADELHHAVELNRSYNSLKWLIYSLRDELTQSEIETLYFNCLTEVAALGQEAWLYDDVMRLRAALGHQKTLAEKRVELERYPVRDIGDWKVLINEGEENLTAAVFKRRAADVIIFCNANTGAAGIVFNERDTDVLNYFTVPLLFAELGRRGGLWKMIGKNLIICGGLKAPDAKTSIRANELFALLEKHFIRSLKN